MAYLAAGHGHRTVGRAWCVPLADVGHDDRRRQARRTGVRGRARLGPDRLDKGPPRPDGVRGRVQRRRDVRGPEHRHGRRGQGDRPQAARGRRLLLCLPGRHRLLDLTRQARGPQAPAGAGRLARTSSMSSSLALVISCSRAASGSAPGRAYRMMPSRMIISVGMDEIPNVAASSGSASVSTLPNTASAYRSDAFSKTGANIRHGPHQAAQKSTRTRPPPLTVESKLSAVSSTVAIVRLLAFNTRRGMYNEEPG